MKKFIFLVPTPTNLSLMWNFGSMLGMSMTLQVVTGVFLSMHYTPNVEFAFTSYMMISKIIFNGFFIQVIHAHFSSIIFIILFIHIMKSLLNKSFNKKTMWVTGNIMLILIMASAFLGYVLPWGQMSFWGATVITNILSSIPFIGSNITVWVWGGYSVNNSTLNRFFSLHFILPFVILIFSIIHLNFLHIMGSSNQMGFISSTDKIYFSNSFLFKDMVSFLILILMYMYMLLFFLDHHFSMAKENFFPADPLNTPIHIKPEWYFMFAYSLLRSVPSKIGGIMSLFLLFITFFSMMFFPGKSTKFCFFKKLKIYIVIFLFVVLTSMGYKSIEYPFTEVSLFTGYFMMLILLI